MDGHPDVLLYTTSSADTMLCLQIYRALYYTYCCIIYIIELLPTAVNTKKTHRYVLSTGKLIFIIFYYHAITSRYKMMHILYQNQYSTTLVSISIAKSLQHMQVTITNCNYSTRILVQRIRRVILVLKPLQHIQMAFSSSISTRLFIPRTRIIILFEATSTHAYTLLQQH
jgi:hypothetical protein